ncbi:multiheme c-type cytochrome [Ferrimonas lipolytica]|uniref:Uncharacterized protein n=1 Tax=Ferrimonas lipolytica TaxID=2724191 RepID=A0A6H1UBJ6_9GAMM|nr:hypothetical protein [Ferrimonas lipolytica]QIZ76019.1 hypothetical protein HER31_03430 [Ferrimonas lipolytica]
MTTQKSHMRLTALAALVAAALTGCSDGSDGNSGEPGRPGGEPAMTITDLNLAVTDVQQVDGQPQVTVLATNQDDESVVGLTDIEVKQYELYPMGYAESGSSARWKSNGNNSAVVDQGNGYYTFTFAELEQNAALTQRYNVVSEAGTLADGTTEVPHNELSYDVDHAGNPALYTKDVVSHDSCAACHTEGEALTRRHSKYQEVETCINCHNETRMAGERSSFQHLVHFIHNDDQSLEDKNGEIYDGVAAEALIGNNCQACHIVTEELAESGNWNRVPTKETCSACHNDGYDADKNTIYSRHLEEQSNSTCSACHTPSQIEEYHIGDYLNADKVADALATTMTLTASVDGAVTATIGLVDANGTAVDAANYADSLDFLEVIGNINPQATQLNYGEKAKAVLRGDEIAATIVDGNLVVVFDDLLAGDAATESALVIAGLRFCAEDGDFAPCSEEADYVSIDSAAGTVAIEGVTINNRHYDSIDSSTCFNCHGDNFQVHNSGVEDSHHSGYTFNDNMQVGDCAACHNTYGTYAYGANQGALEMKLHSAHSSDVADPIVAGDCTKCHTGFNTDSFEDKTAMATGSFYSAETAQFSTPWAATCASCHGFDDEITIEHMKLAGGAVINGTEAEANQAIETCSNCHAADALTEQHGVKF